MVVGICNSYWIKQITFNIVRKNGYLTKCIQNKQKVKSIYWCKNSGILPLQRFNCCKLTHSIQMFGVEREGVRRLQCSGCCANKAICWFLVEESAVPHFPLHHDVRGWRRTASSHHIPSLWTTLAYDLTCFSYALVFFSYTPLNYFMNS